MEATSLRQAVLNVAQNVAGRDGVIEGRVESANPLVIVGANDPALRLTGNTVIVPAEISDRQVMVDIDGVQTTATLRDGLRAGEAVYLLTFGGGRRYMVIGRK